MKEVLKGKGFASVEEVKQMGKSTKRHQNQQVQKLSGEKRLYGCVTSNGDYF